MADVLVNIKGNTQGATDAINETTGAVENLGAAVKNTEAGTQDLEASLKRQEANIKTLDGVINILGGTVETVTGALVLSGVASEEQGKQFEEAALGAIALADGSKRVLDGVKSLNEGLASTGGIAGTVAKSFNKLKAVLIANPLAAVAVAVGAIVSALLIYNETTKKSTEETEEYKKAVEGLDQSLRQVQKTAAVNANSVGVLTKAFQEGRINQQQYVAQLKELGINLEGVNLASEKNLKLVNDLATANNNIASQQGKRARLEGELKLALEKNNEEGDKAVKRLQDEIAELDINTSSYTANRDAILNQIKAQQDANKAKEKSVELLKQEKTAIKDLKTFREDEAKAQKEAVETFLEGIGGRVEQTAGVIQRQLPQATQAAVLSAETATLSFAEQLRKVNMDLNDFFESETGKSISATLGTAANFAKVLADSQDDSTAQAFENSKKFKIASVITSAIQSSFEAFGAAQQFGPILGPILGLAQVATIAIASNKAIQDIKSSTFQGGPKPSTPSVGATRTATGGGAPSVPASFLPGGFLSAAPVGPAARPEPVRAYVVTGDVTNGQIAEEQLQRRRSLGPG